MPGFQTLFAAFLLSLGAGLLSQSPAGLGAFELSLLVLLPQVDQAPLLAAVLAYRVIYFLLPALIALAFLIRPATVPLPAALQTVAGATMLRALARAPQADWSLVHQGAEVALGRDQSTGWLLRMTGRCLVALGRPLGRADLAELRDLAARRGRAAVLYKSDARTAARARCQGWQVVKIAQDAVVDLAQWSPEHPRCRQLRRKLRGLTEAGVRIDVAGSSLPLTEMSAVADAWAARSGGEKGFSMGQFDPHLLARQQVFLAYLDGKLLAFASFHVGRDNWVLDLMRGRADAPSGTMHGLIHAGLVAAGQCGVARVSLAAVPVWPGALAGLSAHLPGQAGLQQFKGSFGPAWQPLYLCSPSRMGLLVAALSVTCAIHADLWLRWTRGAKRRPVATAQQDHAYFQFETGPQACDAQGVISRAAVTAHPADRPQLTGRTNDKRPFPPA